MIERTIWTAKHRRKGVNTAEKVSTRPVLDTFFPAKAIRQYWNAAMSVVALTLHCIPFAAFDFLSDGGATGKALFFLAPLGLILMFGCFIAASVQAVAMLVAFTGSSPSRYHRMYALLVTIAAFGLIALSSRLGWAIHV